MTTPRRITLQRVVDSYRSGWTVVDYLAHRFKYHSAERWRRRVCDGFVRVNDSRVAPTCVVSEGDVVSYTIDHDEPDVDFRYDVVYEDDDLLAVSKSGNLPVHACGVFIRNTLIATLKNRYGDHVNLAHRLDRETSGVVVLTKHRDAARAVSGMFARGEVEKFYLAICHGRIAEPDFEVDAPIGKTEIAYKLDHDRLYMRNIRSDLKDDLPNYVPKRRVDFERGKPARTRFSLVEVRGEFSVVEARPESGRTNQIRVHLQHIGHPLVGDKVYKLETASTPGFPDPSLGRHGLHCQMLAFQHPRTGVALRIRAALPEDMSTFLRDVSP